jgi:hypothetical protein
MSFYKKGGGFAEDVYLLQEEIGEASGGNNFSKKKRNWYMRTYALVSFGLPSLSIWPPLPLFRYTQAYECSVYIE